MAKKTKRKIAHPKLPMQRQLNLQHEGKYFDLRENFDRLNDRFFRGRLRGYKVMWGRRRKRRPKEYFIFGTIQEEERVIRINPLLDQPFVPRWFLQYVLYHEMLHSVVPDEETSAGRRRVHTEQFYRRDRSLGLRHRAGLGITEESDAIAVVVSEETGGISICHRRRIERGFTPETFRKRIGEILLQGTYEETDPEQLAREVDLPPARDNPLVPHQKEPSNDSLAV